jgi:hypothetical protein
MTTSTANGRQLPSSVLPPIAPHLKLQQRSREFSSPRQKAKVFSPQDGSGNQDHAFAALIHSGILHLSPYIRHLPMAKTQ